MRYNCSVNYGDKLRNHDDLIRLSDSREILHIVFVHSVEGPLRASGTPSENVLVWFDLLTVGPTLGSTLEETTRVRKRFFRDWPKSAQLDDELPFRPSYLQRNRLLRRCGEWREVALWFGPSVIEQFSLLQILAALGKRNLRDTRLTLVTCPKLMIGIQRPEELADFFKLRTAITLKRIQFARKAWELYGASNPILLFRFAKGHMRSAPVLCNALLRQLEQYPSVHNGLSVSEEALLREVDVRGTVVRTVGHVLGNDAYCRTGDDVLFACLLGFLYSDVPLIEPVEKGNQVRSFGDFMKLAVKLSTAGRDVLSGKLDQIALNGVDRWIGGVHLKGKTVQWRWDSDKHFLRKCRPLQKGELKKSPLDAACDSRRSYRKS
jgi:hypothetical protein